MVKRLVNTQIPVRAMVAPGDPQRKKLDGFADIEIVEADLKDQARIVDACRGVSHVVHLAAQLVRGDTPVDEFYDTNAFGTLRLLEGVLRSGADIERFVLASTEGTYRPGAPPATPLTEDVVQEPADYYGTSKLLGEIILRNHAAQFDIPFSIARLVTVVSPEEAPKLFQLPFMRAFLSWQAQGKNNHLWPLFHGQPNLRDILDAAAVGCPDATAVGLVGPGGVPWAMHLLDVRDAVDGIYLALTEPAAVGRAFNVAAAASTTHDEGATVVSELLELPKLVVEMPLTWRLEDSIEAARTTLGYRPRHDYRSMVQTAVDVEPPAQTYVPADSKTGVGSLA